MKLTIRNLVFLFCMFYLIVGCSGQLVDKSLKTKSFTVSEKKVKKTMELPSSDDLTGTYSEISDLYNDSDYIASGTVKNIEYFEVDCILLRKINVHVENSYKGNIKKDTIISVLENDGYIRLKSLYEKAKKEYEKNKGDKSKEKEWLYSATFMSDIDDIKNDMLIRYTYSTKTDSKIKDKLLLFLTSSSADTYKNKKVKLSLNNILVYPEGAYVSLGLGMGKFTLAGDSYIRNTRYCTTTIDNGKIKLNQAQFIKGSYTAEEMEAKLKKLNNQ
jgi:hypothetical protein